MKGIEKTMDPSGKAAICHYTIIRFIPNLETFEPVTIGLVLLDEAHRNALVRVRLGRAKLPRSSRRFRILYAWSQALRFLPPSTVDDLSQMHQRGTKILQFSPVQVAVGDPPSLFETLFQEQVMGRVPRTSVAWTPTRQLALLGKTSLLTSDA